MKKYVQTFALVFLCYIRFSSRIAHGYKLVTHGVLTAEAFTHSALSNSALLMELGVKSDQAPFGIKYYDVSGNQIRERLRDEFEGKIIREDLGVNPLSIQGWLMRGAIREDDVCPFSPCDAPDNLIRLLNHFFDPVNDRPLTVGGAALGARATDWATGLQDTYQNPVPDTARANHFSLLDAREAMYRALTGRDSEGNTDIGPGQTPATEAVRKAYWATTFRALGDVLHLVQDMAQPQQIRHATT